jgi:ATP-binding cassette, subfamily B, bacterial
LSITTKISRSIGYSFSLAWKSAKIELSILIFLQLLSGFAPLALLAITQSLVNSVVQLITVGNNLEKVITLFLAQILIVYALYVFQHISTVLDKRIKNVMGETVNTSIFNKSNRIPYINFENPETQNFLQRISSSQSKLLNTIFESTSLIKNIISVLSVLAFLLTKHWIFVVILFLGMLPLFIVEMVFGKKRFELIKFLTPTGRLESYISDLLTQRDSIKEIRLFSLSDYLMNKWRSNYRSYVNEELKVTINNSKFSLIAEFFLVLTYAISGIVVILFINVGRFKVGSFVAILQAIQSIQDSLSATSRNISTIYESALYIEDYRNFLNLEEEMIEQRNDNNDIQNIESIEVRNLTFTYPGIREPALKDISFNISKGKKVAIVGSNGSGKTTLIKCLTGLFEAIQGQILVNGKNVKYINKKNYLRKISVLFQDFQKYNFSVRENIGFGNTEKLHELDEIVKPSQVTGIHSFIDTLDNKYDSILGRLFSGGQDLSGGQWQKIALTRSLLRSGDFLILDEPTSSLDPISEVNIIKNLLDKTQNQSLLLVTHRMSFTHLLDEIIVLKHGVIVERGSHFELMKQEGEYYDLYNAQSRLNSKEGVSV